MGKNADMCADAKAADQHGAIAWRQAIACRMSDAAIRHRIKTGRWLKAEYGVFVVSGSPKTFEQRVWIAILAEEDGAAASHLAAGYIQGLVTTRPARIDVTVPHGHHNGRRRRTFVHVARTFGPADTRRSAGIPVTCPARTLVDLAGVTDDDQIQHALDTALNLGLVTIPVLEKYIVDNNLQHLKGLGRLRRLMNDRKQGVFGSGLERKFRRVLTEGEIPQPPRQHGIGDHWVDFVYPEYGIAIEVDGDWHGTVAQLRKDARRQNKIVLAGYMVLRFTTDRLDKEPETVRAEIEQALRGKGWSPAGEDGPGIARASSPTRKGDATSPTATRRRRRRRR